MKRWNSCRGKFLNFLIWNIFKLWFYRAKTGSFNYSTSIRKDIATDLIKLLSVGSNRGFLDSEDQLEYIFENVLEPLNFSILQEKVVPVFIGYLQLKDCFIFETLDRKVVQLVESGLAQVLVDKYHVIKKPAGKIGPKVLTFDHLDAGFFVWLACVAVVILVFIVEVIIGKLLSFFIQRSLKRLILWKFYFNWNTKGTKVIKTIKTMWRLLTKSTIDVFIQNNFFIDQLCSLFKLSL